MLRYPLAVGAGTFIPYVLGGAGAVSLHQLDSDSTWTRFAGNVGAGIEYRFSRIGVRAEARDYVYTFDRYGYDKTQHDIAWQGGVTLSFQRESTVGLWIPRLSRPRSTSSGCALWVPRGA